MAAVYVSNLVINAGANFNQQFDLVETDDSGPKVLSGYSISAQVRKHASSNTKTDFTASITDGAKGQIQISLTPVQTNALKTGRYVYDILLTEDATGVKTRVVEGSVLVREGVTR